jgi:DNA-directed RNA polymerase alpha subunit
MKSVKIIKDSEDTIVYQFKNYSLTLINTLRKVILDGLETLTVDYCSLDMPFGHPIDAHSIISTRLALIPFKCDPYYLEKLYNYEDCRKSTMKDGEQESEPCFGCRSCGAEFVIKMDYESCKIENKNPNTGIWTLTSGDFIIGEGVAGFIEPAVKDIAIMKFDRNQKVFANGWLRKGNGYQHSKWGPVSVCYHKIRSKRPRDPRFDKTDPKSSKESPNETKDFIVDLTIESLNCYKNKELLLLAIQCFKNKIIGIKNGFDMT